MRISSTKVPTHNPWVRKRVLQLQRLPEPEFIEKIVNVPIPYIDGFSLSVDNPNLVIQTNPEYRLQFEDTDFKVIIK